MYTPTILHVSCMAKIDNIHEQWLLATVALKVALCDDEHVTTSMRR